MEESQVLRAAGQKRRRGDDTGNDDQDLPVAKRPLCSSQQIPLHENMENKELSPLSHPLEDHSLPTMCLNSTPEKAVGSQEASGHEILQPQQGLGELSTDSAPLFPQFRMLPPELRRHIWRETWEHRGVQVTRRTFLNRTQQGEMPGYVSNHVRATQQHWSANQHKSHGCYYSELTQTRATYTSSTARPPVSLWVNRESRDETLLYFGLAFTMPFTCPYKPAYGKPSESSNGGTRVLFNFDLDRLVFPLHSPLSTAFSQADLRRLRRVSIPELAPTLPRFINGFGQFKHPSPYLLPKVDDEDLAVCHDEFKIIWRLLRKWFPSLREIHLDKFSECQRYQMTERRLSNRQLLTLVRSPCFCNACRNIQTDITRNFPKLGMKEHYGPQYDMDCILEGHSIMQPVFKRQTLIIGRVRGERGRQDEDVTVTYWAIHDDDRSKVVDLKGRVKDWDLVRRQMVARTLERALGPPLSRSSMVYQIGP